MEKDTSLDLTSPRICGKRVYLSFRQFFNENLQSMESVEGTGDLANRWATLPIVELPYDSKSDTLEHIQRVNCLLLQFSQELMERAMWHDQSKLGDKEKPYFDKYTPLLKGTTYGSEEYKENLGKLQVALNHHYRSNRHHPEHYPHGIDDMDLADIIEMFFDWKAASERHADGDIMKSIEHNKGRFKISDQLAMIFKNTAIRRFHIK